MDDIQDLENQLLAQIRNLLSQINNEYFTIRKIK